MKYMNSAQRVLETIIEFIMVIIDCSPSMENEDYAPSRKEGAIIANTRLIEAKARMHPQDKMGIITFGEDAHLLHSPVTLEDGANRLCKSMRKDYEYYCGTNFTAALEQAEHYLENKPVKTESSGILSSFFTNLLFEESDPHHIKNVGTNDNVTRRIIMLTDGEHNGDSSPVDVAKRLKNDGVVIECIGIAGSPGQVDEAILKNIASCDENGKPRYCFIGDTDNLIKKYTSMAHHIRPV